MSDNGNEHLPPGWEQVSLGEILPLNYGRGLTKKQRDGTGVVPVFGSSGIVGTHSQALTSGSSLIIGRKGSVGEVYYSPVPCWPIDTTYFCEATESTNLRFFNYLLKSLDLGRLDKSTTIPGLSRDDYNTMLTAIPPSSEQSRIVEEIEHRFSQLDAGIAVLKRVKSNLKNYCASTLQAACEGRLVPTEAELARTDGREYEPAAQLLKRILKERRATWEVEQLAKIAAQDKVPKGGKWKAKYKEPVGPDTSELPELPEGWTPASLEQVTSATRVICYGILMPKENVPDGIPYVRVKDMKGGRIDLRALRRTAPEIAAAYARASLKPRDVLLAIRGTYGRVAEVPNELDGGNITQDTARLVVGDLVYHRYVFTLLRSPAVQNYFKRVARGVTVKGVNIADVRLTPIMLPPLPEQHRIVAEVDNRLSILDKVEVAITANLKRAERLRQAILKQAIEGQLVPQDPNDEPASVLLQRIRKERVRKEAVEEEKRKSARKKMAKTKRAASKRDRKLERQSLLEVLNNVADHLTPEQLFNQSGYASEDIEEFYEELKREVSSQRIEQERPNNTEVYLRAVGR